MPACAGRAVRPSHLPPPLCARPRPDIAGAKLLGALAAAREWAARAQACSKELKASRGELPAWEAPAARARELLKEAEGLGVRMDAELKALQVCSGGRAGRAG